MVRLPRTLEVEDTEQYSLYIQVVQLQASSFRAKPVANEKQEESHEVSRLWRAVHAITSAVTDSYYYLFIYINNCHFSNIYS